MISDRRYRPVSTCSLDARVGKNACHLSENER
jgi:hypothetical protein